jgi:collagenase-like PrtC family protease
MKFSVACNFDLALLTGLEPYPVYEVYGKLTSDHFGGGRPSFYLPSINETKLKSYVESCHGRKIAFNYLLNSSTMGNMEFTRQGQRKLDELFEWLDGMGVDSVTVASPFFLKLVKTRYPRLKVRISSHRYTDTPRKIRFWAEQGADYIVISEVGIYREFKVLEAMRKAAGDRVELQLIVNNWCRQDCAIAGIHASALNHASQKGSRGFPLDYCSILCNYVRLMDPVNYVRANWIRPEDLRHYEDLGYENFKIVERNTPTKILVERVKAYHSRHYDGNLLDLFQNYAYPYDKLGEKEKESFSTKRLFKYFVKPRAVNLFKFIKVIKFGKMASVMYPLRGPNPVFIDNRKLDGFIDFFRAGSCAARDCDECGYCHQWARKSVEIDPQWKAGMEEIYDDLLGDLHSGAFWEPYYKSAIAYTQELSKDVLQRGKRIA